MARIDELRLLAKVARLYYGRACASPRSPSASTSISPRSRAC